MRKPIVKKRETVFTSKRFSIESLDLDYGTLKKTLYTVKHPDIVAVVPVLDKKTLVLGKEYRPKVGRYFLSIVAGLLEEGEKPETAAKRELQEEIGYTCSSLKKLTTFYPMVGLTSAKTHIFVATGLTKTHQKLDEGELITPKKVKLADVQRLIKSGQIADSKTLIGLMTYMQKSE